MRSSKLVPSDAGRSVARRATIWTALVVGLASLACSPPAEGPHWIDLAAGFRPRPLEEIARGFTLAAPPEERARIRLHDDHESVWFERSIPRSAWTRDAATNRWSTPRPLTGGFEQVPEWVARLADAKAEHRPYPGGKPVLGDFMTSPDTITLLLAPDQEPPESMVFGVRASSGAAFDGTWYVRRNECSGPGIPVWSGQREEVVADVPAACVLRVTTSRWDPAAPRAAGDEPRLRILLDGETLLDVAQSERWSHHRLPLPAAGRAGAHFVFEMQGAGVGLFFAPTIEPAEVGRSGARPWGGERPDLLFFLADTFRADNLAAWGGAPEIAPELNRAASRGRRFLQTRSTGSWTLPSISSILTGLYPPQHGATDKDFSLSQDLTTIAEVLREAGYRTGAITDGAFFSQPYGLAQGFDWFVEFPTAEWDVDRTVDEALAFLDRDDGRPVFLVVHSYRAHGPYRQGADEDSGPWDALYGEGLAQFTAEERHQDLARQIYLSLAERFRALYLGAAHDLDRGFGRFADELERRGTLANGYLVFTSDHGEAFGENGDVWHGYDLWETKLHVPLFLRGPGVEPGEDARPVSLVDLAPTFAALAGLAPDPAWEGLALVDPRMDGLVSAARAESNARTTYAFDRTKDHEQLAILSGGHKVLAGTDPETLAAGTFQHAFDLASDPGEEHPQDALDWPAALCRASAETVRRLLVPHAKAVKTTGERDGQLNGIGYTGDDKKKE